MSPANPNVSLCQRLDRLRLTIHAKPTGTKSRLTYITGYLDHKGERRGGRVESARKVGP
jgi:hypothetical protein